MSIIYNAITLPPIDDDYHAVLVRFNSSSLNGEVNMTVSNNIPAAYNNGAYKLVAAYEQSLSLCTLQEDTQQIYVSLFISPNYIGNVSFETYVYPAELNFNDRVTIEISTKKNDLFYFRTAAYSTTTSTRRMIVEGAGGRAYMSGPFQQCNNVNNILTTEPTYCIDLPIDNQEDLKYYPIYFDDVYDGKVEVQKGKCADYSGVSSVIVSIISLLSLLLI